MSNNGASAVIEAGPAAAPPHGGPRRRGLLRKAVVPCPPSPVYPPAGRRGGPGSASPAIQQAEASATPVAVLKRVAKSHNLTVQQYEQVVRILGRQPTLTEVGIFGVSWSEHCCYASSKIYLKQFPTKGKRILVPAGKENAGVVDLGDGVAVAFKVESHNHPSAIEPVQGAATGVGGILRDIFTMGARPVALFDSLRFGPLDGDARTAFLFEGVVQGIAGYGNCVGVPTVGGEILFDPSYRGNPLVNVMCIGLLSKKQLAHGAAQGIGNPVIYVGSSTGRDGLGGASFASRDLEEGDADRPAVQIGDPFTEKCLIEATLEALATGDVVGIQDMGAAGLTCSTCEMPSRGGTGIEIDVALVPRREEGMIPPPAAAPKARAAKRQSLSATPAGGEMTPYEVMLSESQERMLLVAKKGRESTIKKIFAKWGLNAVEIGRVTADGRMRVRDGGAVVADIPVKALTSEAPVYHRPVRRPRYLSKAQQWPLKRLPQPKDFNAALLTLLGSPTIANKAHVFEQYDHMVQTNTAVLPGRADAAVLRLKGSEKFLAATIDGNGRYCYLDPYEGGKAVVAEAARNLVCVGATPLAITDCLNFGSPLDPEIMWQFRECVRGIGDACRAFETPVTGGNVSFYNQGSRGAIDPTPIVGMIGVIETGSWKQEAGKGRIQPPASSLQLPLTANFKDAGDVIVLLGETREELGGSEYLLAIHSKKAGRPPRVDLAQERALQQVMLEAARQEWLKSAHDCSEGGLAVALAECCIIDEQHLIGATVQFGVRCSVFGAGPTTNYELRTTNIRSDALLFGESAGRIVISCERRFVEPLLALAKKHG
ncbi:MAG: phosphoribosylformylglycinamidine synthase subunit PurL, partial [Candidatus Omnitrophica bacterium]|nr:phosphoribosylformylglycinamidine synthase subunit PurL [Candidatus Omnitrophota bacterium]